MQQFQVTIDKATGALKRGVVQFTATVDAPTFPRSETTLLLALAPTAPATEDIQDENGAVIASSDGEVVLLAMPASARTGVVFRYRELYNAEVVSSHPDSLTIVKPQFDENQDSSQFGERRESRPKREFFWQRQQVQLFLLCRDRRGVDKKV